MVSPETTLGYNPWCKNPIIKWEEGGIVCYTCEWEDYKDFDPNCDGKLLWTRTWEEWKGIK